MTKSPSLFVASDLAASRVGTSMRWRRYSLRTAIVLITVVSLVVGMKAAHVRRQQALVRLVERHGGQCEYDDWREFTRRRVLMGSSPSYGVGGAYRPPPPRWITPRKPWLRRTLGDAWFAEIEAIVLTGPHVDNATLAELRLLLSKLPTVRELRLRGTSVTHEGLRSLVEQQQLRRLNLYETPIQMDDPGMVELLARNPHLSVSF